MLGTAYLLTRDRQAAEELVQDTLVALYPQWAKVAEAQSPIAYVRRSLINRYLNQQRRPRHRSWSPTSPPPGHPNTGPARTSRARSMTATSCAGC